MECPTIFILEKYHRLPRSLAAVEIRMLPVYVVETIQEGCLAFYDGQLYGTSAEHVLGTDWKSLEEPC